MGTPLRPDRRCVRFGPFELDSSTGELRKHGVRVRLQEQPLKVLLCLLRMPGEVVTREELQRSIWPQGTFVDYDHGLNTAVTRLRQVMGDSAESPRYVETLGRKGYRFIAPVQEQPPARMEPAVDTPAPLSPEIPSPGSQRAGGHRWIAVSSLALTLIVAGIFIWWRVSQPSAKPLMRMSDDLGPELSAAAAGPGNLLALSPDGSRIVLTVTGADGHRRLATRRLDQGQLALVPDTEEAGAPFFSPDGEWVGFFARGKMRKVNVNGGAPVTLADAFTGATGPLGLFPSAGWGDDGTIVATLTPTSGLVRVPGAGGAVAPITASKTIEGEIPRWPQVLPGSRAVLFTAAGRNYENGNIDVIVPQTGERKTIHRGGFRARYAASGHILFISKNSLYAAPFDLQRLSMVGSPHPVIEDIAERLGQGWHFDVSTNGSFAYVSSHGEPAMSIFLLGRNGETEALDSTPGLYGTPRFSRDGKYLAFSIKSGEGQQIWLHDLARGTRSRLTSLAGVNDSPVWTHDSQHILFRSVGQPAAGIYAVRADRSTEVKRVLELRNEEYPTAISPDGKTLAMWDFNGGGAILTAPVHTQDGRMEVGKPELFAHVAFNPSSPSRSVPAFSPDGRWLAYGSNESGKIEIYVTRFPGPGPKWRVSTDGGVYPVWSPNRRELLYKHEPSEKIMVVRYSSNGEDFVSGPPEIWTERAVLGGIGEKAAFDISSNGKQIVALMFSDRTSQPRPITNVTFLFNFFDELRRVSTQNRK